MDGQPEESDQGVHTIEVESKVMETFEDMFFRYMFFSGSQTLTDPCLKSILAMDQSGLIVETVDGKTFVYQRHDFRNRLKDLIRKTKTATLADHKFRDHRRIHELNRALKMVDTKKWRSTWTSFFQEFNLPFDRISSRFPMCFSSFRLVLHSLKAAHGLYCTLQMFGFDEKLVQLARISQSRKIWVERRENLLSLLFTQIYRGLERAVGSSTDLESKWIKVLKTSLCRFVSRAMRQTELPQGDRVNLFPPSVWKWINGLSQTERVRFAHSCLQSKQVFQEVPDSFVQKALEDHQAQLSEPHRGLSQEMLDRLREVGQEFGRRVAKRYNPNKSRPASGKATFAFPRQKGGVKGDLVFNDRLRVSQTSIPVIDPIDRPEPLVIGFFGQPGQGKSTRLYELVQSLRILFPGVADQDLVYCRSCNVRHWDGYRQQPIVIMDDLGQSADGDDIQEFQTLVSCNPYVLPMASLDEKGCLFASTILITTSNLVYGASLAGLYQQQQPPIIDENSFWRRFHLPIYVEKGIYHFLEEPVDFVDATRFLYTGKDIRQKRPAPYGGQTTTLPHIVSPGEFVATHNRIGRPHKDLPLRPLAVSYQPWKSVKFPELLKTCKKLYASRRRFADNYSQKWKQSVFETREDFMLRLKELSTDHPEQFGDLFHEFQALTTHQLFSADQSRIETSYEFPAFPPEGPLPIRVHPIKEPLKVRTITCGVGDTFCLKPFQQAMWETLDEYPQFTLTHGTDRLPGAINRIFKQSEEGDVWISGDYTAATDSVAISATEALLSGILESIDHMPTKRWALKEISPHMLIYPEDTGIEPVLQESGQLMGSLLSFPLLCLLNDCTARFIGLHPDQYLINGDDILMRTSPDKYSSWKGMTHELGFTLSPGKNYVSRDYGTVNSQIIHHGEVLPSGKQTVLVRSGKVLGECLRDLELFMSDSQPGKVKELFKKFNRPLLSRTVRSIDIPWTHGGLGFSWGDSRERDRYESYLVYFHDLFRKIDPGNRDVVIIPYLSNKQMTDRLSLQGKVDLFEQVLENAEYHEDFLSPAKLQRTQRRIRKNRNFRELFRSRDLADLPPLNFVETIEIPMGGKDFRTKFQSQITELFLNRIYSGDYSETFSYSFYREDLIRKLSGYPDLVGLDNKEVLLYKQTSEYLINLADVTLLQDAIPYLNLKAPVVNYSREWFAKELKRKEGGVLTPNHYDLPTLSEVPFVDYSELFETLVDGLLEEIPHLGIDYPEGLEGRYRTSRAQRHVSDTATAVSEFDDLKSS